MRTMVARLMPNCIVAHQGLAGQLEQDALVGGFGFGHGHLLDGVECT
jgi:hypothetical protein